MTAPGPLAGDNPYQLAYQTEQYDKGHSAGLPHGYGDVSVFDALDEPPSDGVDAQSSPDHLYLENTDPPIGAGGNTGP